LPVIGNIFNQVRYLDLDNEDKRYVFSLKTQRLYTAVEDLLKSTAKCFENHIEDSSKYHFELLRRMATEVPGIRPVFISENSLKILDKLRSFRHFIRHAYDYELDKEELKFLQHRLNQYFEFVLSDFTNFQIFLNELAS
jgi:hypothetical protein